MGGSDGRADGMYDPKYEGTVIRCRCCQQQLPLVSDDSLYQDVSFAAGRPPDLVVEPCRHCVEQAATGHRTEVELTAYAKGYHQGHVDAAAEREDWD